MAARIKDGENLFKPHRRHLYQLLANEKAIQIGLDKLDTVNFLKRHGLAHPWTEVVKDAYPPKTPCILKMRSGQGSKNCIKVTDDRLVPFYQETRPDDIWQELLLPDDEEYTCGLYRTKCKEIRKIIIKRKLQGGLTGSGIVVQNDQISQYLDMIAVSLNLQGSINVQLRYTECGPVTVELNRFPGFYIEIRDEGDTVIWDPYVGYALVISGYTFEPGELMENIYTWDLANYHDDPVPAGQYEIIGMPESSRVTVTVVPEPTSVLLLLAGGGVLLRRMRIGA